jgi:crossover junction endodeoxyribonuclease RuvC
LYKIYQAILKLIFDTKPEVLVLEKLYAHYRHPTTAYLLGQARGVICLACAQMNIPLVEYAATQVKKAVVGRGLASKYQVQRMVTNMLNLNTPPKYTDITDALALAIAHSYIIRSKMIRHLSSNIKYTKQR